MKVKEIDLDVKGKLTLTLDDGTVVTMPTNSLNIEKKGKKKSEDK